jgi:hypothetical protein
MVVRFTGATHDPLTGTVLALNGDYGIFMVRRLRNPLLTNAVTWCNGNDASIDGMCDADPWLDGQVSLAHIAVANATWGAGTAALEKVIWRHDGTANTATLQLNGADLGTVALADQVAPTGALRLGARFDNGVSGSDVDILDWWAWARWPTDVEAAELDAYARIKYGI